MRTLASLVLPLLLTTLPARAADWPTWRGPDRSNRSPDSGLLQQWPDGGPPLLWTFRDAGKGYSSPAIVGDRIYLTGQFDGKDRILCLDAASGGQVWAAPLGEDPGKGYNTGWGSGPRGAVTVSDGRVFAIAANGELACVSAADGRPVWRRNLVDDFGGKIPKWGYAESPLVHEGKVVVTPGGAQGAIVALDPATGETLWRSKELEDEAQYSSIVVAEAGGRTQLIQLFMKSLAAVAPEDGELLWREPWRAGRVAVIPTPVVDGDEVYVTAGYGAGSRKFDIAGDQPEELWSNKVMKVHHGGVVLVDGHVYGFSDGSGLTCQSWADGERVWNQKGAGIQKGAVHYADGMLVCLDEAEGSVFLAAASPDGYAEKGRFPMPEKTKLREGTRGKVWTHPVVLNGRLYLRDQDLLFCFDLGGK